MTREKRERRETLWKIIKERWKRSDEENEEDEVEEEVVEEVERKVWSCGEEKGERRWREGGGRGSDRRQVVDPGSSVPSRIALLPGRMCVSLSPG